MSSDSAFTPIPEILELHKELNNTFLSGVTRSIEWRKQQLIQLAKMIKENHTQFAEAIHVDMGKPALEAYLGEIGPLLERILISVAKLDEWAATIDKSAVVPEWQKAWNAKVFKEPKGVALVIAPWNYPMILSLQPFHGAVSAGCCCALKVSEIAPAYANLVRSLFPKYMDQTAFRIITGGVEETTKALELKWDHSKSSLSFAIPSFEYRNSFLYWQRHCWKNYCSGSSKTPHTGYTRTRWKISSHHRSQLYSTRPGRTTNSLR
jgi:aldehyde dehydrogenase (NAD+)